MELTLTPEEPYVPHALAGVMTQNTASAAKESHVWSTGGASAGDGHSRVDNLNSDRK